MSKSQEPPGTNFNLPDANSDPTSYQPYKAPLRDSGILPGSIGIRTKIRSRPRMRAACCASTRWGAAPPPCRRRPALKEGPSRNPAKTVSKAVPESSLQSLVYIYIYIHTCCTHILFYNTSTDTHIDISIYLHIYMYLHVCAYVCPYMFPPSTGFTKQPSMPQGLSQSPAS